MVTKLANQMKTINLFLKMHFTSLSPDGQCISLAIVSEEHFDKSYRHLYTDKVEIKKGNCSIDHLVAKSFYAEFSDFEINRCDDWVKENVVSKIGKMTGTNHVDSPDFRTIAPARVVKNQLKGWLSEFSDYKLNFIVDCGWFTWYKFVELMGDWEEVEFEVNTGEGIELIEREKRVSISCMEDCEISYNVRTGIPKLPTNFPPVAQDLNELIAFKKGISVSDAFELDREEMASGIHSSVLCTGGVMAEDGINPIKYNALWDAKVTKAIWEKLR